MRTTIAFLLSMTMLFPAATSVEGNATRLSQGKGTASAIGTQAKEETYAADSDRRGSELFNRLKGQGLIDTDDASIRTEIREMLANGGNETHIAAMLRLSKDAGIRGTELRDTLASANTAMLMGVSIRDVSRSLSHTIRSTDTGTPDRERMLDHRYGRFNDTMRRMVSRVEGSRLRDRIRSLAGRRDTLRRYGTRIHDWLAAHPEEAARLQLLLTILRNR
ncbi:MAG: hypothetical protein AABZ39_05935 [Spirochaetota bacterium]